MSATDEIVDSIERHVDIDAPAEKVWPLVSRPGWWINDGEQIDAEPQVRREGDLDVVTHPTYGDFRLRTEESDEPRYVRFHWVDNVAPDAGTSVELWIEDRDGGVTLRVKESGFTSLRKAQEEIANHIADNTRGWELELGLARDFVTGGGA